MKRERLFSISNIMKRIITLCLALCLALHFAPLPAQVLQRRNGQLKFSGSEQPFVIKGTTLHITQFTTVKKNKPAYKKLCAMLNELQGIGINTLTVVPDVDYLHFEEAFPYYDCLLDELRRRDMHAIIVLHETLMYPLRTIDFFLHKNIYNKRLYKTDPTIIAWQIGNITDNASAVFMDWYAEQIRSYDARHLLAVNIEPVSGADNEKLFDQAMRCYHIDLASVTLNPIAAKWSSAGNMLASLANVYVHTSELFDCFERVARSYVKPYIIGAFSYPRDGLFTRPGTGSTARNAFYEYIYSTFSKKQQTEEGTMCGGLVFDGWDDADEWETQSDPSSQNRLQQDNFKTAVYSCDTATVSLIKRYCQ